MSYEQRSTKLISIPAKNAERHGLIKYVSNKNINISTVHIYLQSEQKK
jgi:hypothetical protein